MELIQFNEKLTKVKFVTNIIMTNLLEVYQFEIVRDINPSN